MQQQAPQQTADAAKPSLNSTAALMASDTSLQPPRFNAPTPLPFSLAPLALLRGEIFCGWFQFSHLLLLGGFAPWAVLRLCQVLVSREELQRRRQEQHTGLALALVTWGKDKGFTPPEPEWGSTTAWTDSGQGSGPGLVEGGAR